MRAQLAAYREEICRLRHANGTLVGSNRMLLDAVTTMKMGPCRRDAAVQGRDGAGLQLARPRPVRPGGEVQDAGGGAGGGGKVHWMCVEKIAENPDYNIFEAGPEMARAPAPSAGAPEPDTICVDQALVAHPAAGGGVAGTERPPVGAPAAPPDQSPTTPHTPAGDRAGTETGPHGLMPPLAAGLRPDSRAAMNCVPPLTRTITDPDHVPFHGKPPPAVSA